MKLTLGFGALGVLLLAACGGTDNASDQPEACRGSTAHPVPAQRVVKAFRANGFAVRASVADQDCARDIAYVVANHGEKDGGTLSCTVWSHAIYKPTLDLNLHAGSSSPIYNGTTAELNFADVECFLHASDEAQVARFARAAQRIARS